jgi:hypothetical protein
MAKSIRSHIKKKFRAVKRSTLGEAVKRKQMRQALRRLKAGVEATEQAAAAAAGAGAGAGSTLAALKAVLTGGSTGGVETGSGARAVSASLQAAAVIRGGAPPKRVKRLRHTFNTDLRAARLADDLEDVTDDEEDMRLGVVGDDDGGEFSRAVERPVSGVIAEDDATGELVEAAGAKKAADKPLPKRMNHVTEATFRDGCVGLFDSDPALKNARKAARKGAKRGRNAQALAATTPDEPTGGSGKAAGGAKAKFRFWGS